MSSTTPDTSSAWPPVLTPETFAELLGFPSSEAARKFIQRYEIPHTPLGKRVFVRTPALLAFLTEREITAGEKSALGRTGPRLAGSSADALRRAGRKQQQRRARAKGVAEGP